MSPRKFWWPEEVVLALERCRRRIGREKKERNRVEEEERREKERRGAWQFFNHPASTVITFVQPS